MKYYEGHENAYRKLAAEGHITWEKKASLDDFDMRPFLEQALRQLGPPPPGARALEIGCGTGPVSLLLAARGYDVLGLDISETAVGMARKHAAERGLAAEFQVRDVVRLEGEDRYDLIVDGHCIHCFVYDEDRAQLFAALRRLLKPTGALVMETMGRQPGLHFEPPFMLDDEGVLWLEHPKGNPEDLKRIGDKLYHPNRRIRPPEDLRGELLRAGFAIELEQVEEPVKTEPLSYQAIARKGNFVT
ncbi:MAG: class I SAM-dependent methyltransferase [Planctomycetota bacterium]|nr:class I SAM-dependent methyltransferase [Planctomycetota bacterium]